MLYRTLVVLSLLATTHALLPAQGTWQQMSPNSNPPRSSGHSMAFDLRRKKIVLFGGGVAGTWEWDGKDWTKRSPTTSPPNRQQFEMVYDLKRGVTVLFGGAYVGDTWEWDGTNWTQKMSTNSPSARCCMYMAYDIARSAVVLFGGFSNRSGMMADTWAWDGKNWKQLTPGKKPSPRCCGTMAYDSKRAVCVLFGGASAAVSGDLSDTWEWDGKNWTERKPPVSPRARRSGKLVYDLSKQRIVLFSGGIGNLGRPSLDDTWEWDGQFWTQRNTPKSPAKRFIHAMAYDWIRSQTVLFGGRTGPTKLNDTWVYSSKNSALFSAYGSGCRGSAGVPTLDATIGPPWLGQAYEIQLGMLPTSGAALLFLGASKSKWGPITLPLSLDPLGMKGCSLFASADLAFALTITNGSTAWKLTLPTLSSLAGLSFFNQGFVLDKTANSLGLSVSNAGESRLGIK